MGKDVVKGVCEDTKCFYDTYSKEYLDSNFASINYLNNNYLNSADMKSSFYTKDDTYSKTEVDNKIKHGTSLPTTVTNGQIFLLYK